MPKRIPLIKRNSAGDLEAGAPLASFESKRPKKSDEQPRMDEEKKSEEEVKRPDSLKEETKKPETPKDDSKTEEPATEAAQETAETDCEVKPAESGEAKPEAAEAAEAAEAKPEEAKTEDGSETKPAETGEAEGDAKALESQAVEGTASEQSITATETTTTTMSDEVVDYDTMPDADLVELLNKLQAEVVRILIMTLNKTLLE